MNQVWQLWPSALDNNLIDTIKEISNKYPSANPGLGFDGSTANNDYRESEIRWLNASVENTISGIISNYTSTANRNAFGFYDATYINDIQYTKYSVGGKYDWHEDIFWDCPRPYHRKITFVAQLSSPEDYVGGLLEIDPQFQQPPAELLLQKGTIIVFPSFIKHRVTPLIYGTRESLVSWVEGPKFR